VAGTEINAETDSDSKHRKAQEADVVIECGGCAGYLWRRAAVERKSKQWNISHSSQILTSSSALDRPITSHHRKPGNLCPLFSRFKFAGEGRRIFKFQVSITLLPRLSSAAWNHSRDLERCVFFDSHRRGLRVSIDGGVDEIHSPQQPQDKSLLSTKVIVDKSSPGFVGEQP
jgi:hypothetical protein